MQAAGMIGSSRKALQLDLYDQGYELMVTVMVVKEDLAAVIAAAKRGPSVVTSVQDAAGLDSWCDCVRGGKALCARLSIRLRFQAFMTTVVNDMQQSNTGASELDRSSVLMYETLAAEPQSPVGK